ncbi:MAG: hypothetical protein AABY78_05705 [Nitrospirota bacterium]
MKKIKKDTIDATNINVNIGFCVAAAKTPLINATAKLILFNFFTIAGGIFRTYLPATNRTASMPINIRV